MIGQVAKLNWPRERVELLAVLRDDLGFELRHPSRKAIARWVADGMTPTQAAYAALAEESERPALAGDPELARLAGRLPRG